MKTNHTWWKEAVVYQIYPRSFYDTNGDGIGDLKGIILKLDYIKSIGVDTIWLCPVYQSPNCDNGYDISDYHNIMDEFGNMDDMTVLLAEAHKRGLKLIMDLVVNHTSDEHAWFVESQKSKSNPYRDYYIWRSGVDGQPPNNWQSFFGGSAWKYNEQTGEYYLHIFADKQPDLNWENEKVRQDIFDLMTWWFERGIDGFRMDAINIISKNHNFPNVKDLNEQLQNIANGPHIHEYLQEMNRKVLSKHNCLTVGECGFVSAEQAKEYVGEDRNELNMIFEMEHVSLDKDFVISGEMKLRDWKLTDFKRIFNKWDKSLDGIGWNSLFLSNHDQPRAVSRFGNDKEYRTESAKMLATFLLTMRGTPYIYQGEEIGMTNVAFSTIDDYRDLATFDIYNIAVKNGRNPAEVLKEIPGYSRDNARTPMQWDTSSNAGFTGGTPWIKVNPNYPEINVEQAMGDKNSIYHYYQKIIKIRKEHLTLVYGDFRLIAEDDEQIFAYIRSDETEKFLVALNFSDKDASLLWEQSPDYKPMKQIISNYASPVCCDVGSIKLRPFEAVVYQLA